MSDDSVESSTAARADVRASLSRLAEATTREDRTAILTGLLDGAEGKLDLGGSGEVAARLEGVSLPGARLRGSRLAYAELQHADFSNGFLAQADLRWAQLEGANLADADLSHADCTGAQMGEVILRSALAEDARLEGASLRFADLREVVMEGAVLTGADLWGAQMEGGDFSNAALRGASIGESFAASADFSHADLREANLIGAALQNASFRDADLRGANLKGAQLAGADFTGAQLGGLDLSSCDLAGARWGGARLDRTSFGREQLGGAVGEERDAEFHAAGRSYMALERNFSELGDTEAASWAYRRKRRMQKMSARQGAAQALKERRWSAFCGEELRYLGDQLAEWICDYGESVGRVFGSLLVVYLGFTVLYGVTGSVTRTNGSVQTVTHNPFDLAIFSLMAMSTMGTPAITLSPSHVYALYLSGLQALLGIFLTGLLGFVAGNRIRR